MNSEMALEESIIAFSIYFPSCCWKFQLLSPYPAVFLQAYCSWLKML